MDLKAVCKRIITSRWFIFSTAAVVVYVLLGFLLLPYLASHYLKTYVKDHLAHELMLQKLRLNPFTLTVKAEGFGVAAPKQAPLMSIDFFSADFDLFASLHERAWAFASIRMSNPFLQVVVQEDGRSNLAELFVDRKSGKGKQAKQVGTPSLPRILLEDVTLRGGKINFVDRRESPAAEVRLTALAVDLEELTTLPDRTGKYTVAARTKAGERLQWRGSVSLNPIRSAGSLNMEGVKAATVWKFLQEYISCNEPDGEMSLTSDYLFDLSGKQPIFALRALDFDVSNLTVTLKGASSPMIWLQKVTGRQGRVQWHKRNVALTTLRMEGGRLRMQVDGHGIANWRKLIGGQQAAARQGLANGSQSSEQHASNPQRPLADWTASLSAFKLEDFQVAVTDLTTDPAARLELASFDLDLAQLSTDPAASVNFNLHTRIKAGGDIAARGRTSLWQREVDGHVRVAGLSLLPLQPYLKRVVRLTLDAGSLDAAGAFSYGRRKGDRGFTYQGQGKILALRARTGDHDQPAWGWDSLSCNVIHLRLSPGSLALGEVRLLGPLGRLIIYNDKTLNLSRLLVRKKDEHTTKNRETFRIIADRIRLEHGSLAFADLSQTPRFRAQIHELQGSVNGVSSISGTRAQIELEGQVNQNGMTRIQGETDLFHPTGTTKIRMDFRNIDMTGLTPYAVHFAGYRVASGKLSLHLRYSIEQGKMVGRNQIIAEKFTLGERVKSPTALDLPFKLAIALLKDAKGTIDIGLPVRGNLNNPQFDFGDVIRKAMGNFLKKIVTAPFSWLATLVGYHKKDFETIFFDPGKADLLPPEKEKLSKLSEALAKRPRLQLAIHDGYEPVADIPALKSALLRKRVAAKESQTLEAGENPGPVVFHNPETQKAVEALFLEYYPAERLSYLKADFRKTLQPAQNAPDENERAAAWADFYEDLYRRIKARITIPASRLRSLAAARGAAVRRFLARASHVDPGRIRVLDPIQTQSRNGKDIENNLSLDAAA